MAKNIFYVCLICTLFVASCEKEKSTHNTGKITISSRKYLSTSYYVKGFSFEKNKYVNVVLQTEDADIAPVDSINLHGEAVGIRLSVLSNNPSGFYLNEKHDNAPDAITFFNNYKTVHFPSSIQLTPLLEPFDVFTLKTQNNNYVKLLITEVRKVSDFFEADIRYVIQKNGAGEFPE